MLSFVICPKLLIFISLAQFFKLHSKLYHVSFNIQAYFVLLKIKIHYNDIAGVLDHEGSLSSQVALQSAHCLLSSVIWKYENFYVEFINTSNNFVCAIYYQ